MLPTAAVYGEGCMKPLLPKGMGYIRDGTNNLASGVFIQHMNLISQNQLGCKHTGKGLHTTGDGQNVRSRLGDGSELFLGGILRRLNIQGSVTGRCPPFVVLNIGINTPYPFSAPLVSGIAPCTDPT